MQNLREPQSKDTKYFRHTKQLHHYYYHYHITTMSAIAAPTITLANGVKMPALGFGTFANEGSVGETHKAVIEALKAGYRHLDCAWFYQNEGEVGTGVQEFLSQNPSVRREDIFITTKVWQHLHEPDDVEWSIKNSLEKLQTSYVDAFLIHWPFAAEKEDNLHVKIGADGKVRSSSFSCPQRPLTLPHRKKRKAAEFHPRFLLSPLLPPRGCDA